MINNKGTNVKVKGQTCSDLAIPGKMMKKADLLS